MKLEFIVNKSQLISTTIKKYNTQKRAPFPVWGKLEARIYKKYKNEPAYYFVNPYIKSTYTTWALEELVRQSALSGTPLKKTFSTALQKISTIYQEIEESTEFSRLYKETNDYLLLTKKRWDEKKVDILKFITAVSGITIPKKTVTVFINHPKAGGGEAYSQSDALRWGHQEDWPNYTVIYLAHELLHILTKKKQIRDDIMHSLIELMIDNELRILLSGKGEYFSVEGHTHLRELERALFPVWQEYLAGKLKVKNIFELEKYIIKKGIA